LAIAFLLLQLTIFNLFLPFDMATVPSSAHTDSELTVPPLESLSDSIEPDAGQHGGADSTLDTPLPAASLDPPPSLPTLLSTVKAAANLALNANAAQHQMEALARLRANQSIDSATLLPTSKLAASLLQQRFVHEATMLYQLLLVEQETHCGMVSLDVATTCLHLGECLRRTKEVAKAEELIRRAVELRKTLCGASHPLVAMALNSLAAVLREAGQQAASKQAAQEALDIFQQVRMAKMSY
jgi:tetratricopeptide (TPR) repeat protein